MKQGKTFWIPGHVPSSKNLTTCACTKAGKPYTRPNGRVEEYKTLTDPYFQKHAQAFWDGYWTKDLLGEYISDPARICVGFHFVRQDKREFDFINACQIVQDRMVHWQWIKDDSMRYLIPFPLWTCPKAYLVTAGYHTVAPLKPGVAIRIIAQNANPYDQSESDKDDANHA